MTPPGVSRLGRKALVRSRADIDWPMNAAIIFVTRELSVPGLVVSASGDWLSPAPLAKQPGKYCRYGCSERRQPFGAAVSFRSGGQPVTDVTDRHGDFRYTRLIPDLPPSTPSGHPAGRRSL